MSSIFIEHLPQIFIAYGLSFLLLGVVASVLPRNDRSIPFAAHLWLLSIFGVVHGLQELVDGERVHNHAQLLTQISGVLCIFSFLALTEFARRATSAIHDWKLLAPVWIYGFASIAAIIFTSVAHDFWNGLTGSVRFFLGFPGALLCSYMLYAYSKRLPDRVEFKDIRKWVTISAVGFLVYALITPLLGNPDPGFPSWLPTAADFLATFNIPVQLPRTVCAFVTALSFIAIIQQSATVINTDLMKSLRDAATRSVRLAKEQEGVARIASLAAVSEGEFKLASRSICEIAAEVLQVERCSIWMLNEDGTELTCINLFKSIQNTHEARGELSRASLAAELDHLANSLYLATDSPASHPCLLSLADTYLRPNRISSKLDVLIKSGNGMLGVLMLEHVDHPHQWSQDEVTFASQLADQLALTYHNKRRKENEKAIGLAKDAAESASRAKSEFLSSMSHELRTPLNAILGFSQIMETDEDLPEQVRDFSGEIVRAGKHMLALVTDMIDLARIEAGRLELSVEPVLINTVVQESLAIVAPIAVRQGITIIDETGASAGIRFLTDHARTRQILINFLSNAIKYNQPGGSSTITCRVNDERVRISVSDTGLGIPMDKQDRIFNAFDRLGKECGTIEGTGIGLVITKRIVEALKGAIGFESAEGVGSTFWVEFDQVK